VKVTPLFGQLALALSFCGLLVSAPVVEDDFEYFILSDDWDNPVVNTDLESGEGARGSSQFARINPTTGILGAKFEGGTSDFFVDFHLRIYPGARQFNFMVMTDEEVSYDEPTINLRHENENWEAFDGSWNQIALPGMETGEWYHLRITCKGWGGDGATYDIELSDAGGTAFTSSVTDLVFYDEGEPDATTAGAFSFSARWGSSPGFDLDNVTVETIDSVGPEVPLVISNFEYSPDASTSTFTWNAVPGTIYYVYATSDLVHWEEVGVRVATGSEEVFVEEDVPAGFRAYRVQDFPAP
jgi:hypothetical protein